ncbi:MAG: hypothetical protein ABIP30_01825 [Ferruginibacter sp.]
MKKLLTLLVITIFSVAITSCKKDDAPKTIVGYWTGKSNTADASSDWHWLVRSDKTVRVYIGVDSATATKKFEGTYSNTDSTISLNYKVGGGLAVSLSNAKINNGYTRIEGKDFLGNTYFVQR